MYRYGVLSPMRVFRFRDSPVALDMLIYGATGNRGFFVWSRLHGTGTFSSQTRPWEIIHVIGI
jgi:hypothetical protein